MNWASLSEQRLGALGENAAWWRRNGWISAEQEKSVQSAAATPWRRHSIPLTITFFVLTCIAVAAFSAFLKLLHLPYGPVALIASIATAEFLIRSYRFERTGVESALWITGLVVFIFWLPSQNKPEALLVFAAAFLIAGLRVRNAVLLAATGIFVVVYVAAKGHSFWPSLLTGLLFALSAAAALVVREWRHPWIEKTLSLAVIFMPLVGYLTSAFTPRFRLQVAAVLAVDALLLLVAGILRRHRAIVIAGAVTLAIAAFEAQQRLEWPKESKLIFAGVLVLAMAIMLTRVLRGRTRGFVIDRTAAQFEAMQMLGAVHVSAAPAPAPAQTGLEPGGGSFGGGGATGDV